MHLETKYKHMMTTTPAPCSIDCLYLRPTLSKQEGHELLHLQTNWVIMRRKSFTVPVNPSIISQVHALVNLDGMCPGLKITNFTNKILFDSAWTAEVDHDDYEFQDEDYEMEWEDQNDVNEDEEYDEMFENELAELMNKPDQHNVQNENNRNVQHVYNKVKHDNDNPLKIEKMKTLKKTGHNTKTQKRRCNSLRRSWRWN